MYIESEHSGKQRITFEIQDLSLKEIVAQGPDMIIEDEGARSSQKLKKRHKQNFKEDESFEKKVKET